MGIPHYFYVITKSYHNILQNKLPSNKRCQHFLVDYNGLIHPASAKYLKEVTTSQKLPKDIEKGILQEVWNTTQDLVTMVKPEKTVQLYVDGVAPVAKMSQQRRRRFLSVYRKKKLNDPGLWDSNAISPGTTFMARLTASIRAHIRISKGKQTATDPLEYHFSSADEPGEGEHKLFERMIRLYGTDPNETKVIYGMDADLIMLSLLSNVPNIYLLRENQRVPNEWMYLDVDALRIGIIYDLEESYGFRIATEARTDPFGLEARQVIESYIVICFLLGNDFLPHSSIFQLKRGGLEDLLNRASKIWNETGIPVVDIHTEQIQWNFLTQLLDSLSQNEDNAFYYQVKRHHDKRPPSFENDAEKLEALPLLEPSPFSYELLFQVNRQKWRLHYYHTLFHSPMNDSQPIRSSCDLYLQGILWTYQYYKRKPYDPNWYYPYAYSPTMRDIANYLNGHLPTYEALKSQWETTHPRPDFVHPIVQLLSILPKESVHCLPVKYHPLMTSPASPLTYLYPDSYPLHTFMKEKLWECVPILPPMNIPAVQRAFLGAPLP